MRIARADYEAAMRHARDCRRRLAAAFAEHDVLLTPSAPGEAPEGITSTGNSLFNRNWTLLGVPCVTLPCGAGPGGLPLAVQLVGAAGADGALLHWAHGIREALGHRA
jgi:Asp-tRNA(Asn)/Glu-tRNA(Gln) amidotransferase A subunit family amidase